MPRKVLTLNKFRGLGTQIDDRDINKEFLTSLQDMVCNERGKLEMMGGKANGTENDNWTIKPGYGLFTFSSDYRIYDDSETVTHYIAINNGDDIKIYEAGDSSPDEEISLGNGGNDTKPVYYIVDGALRICDANFGNINNNTPKWFGYIERTHFEGSGGADNYTSWRILNQKCSPPTAGSITGDGYPSAGTGLYIDITADDYSTGAMSVGEYEFASSFVYDTTQESQLYKMSNTVTLMDEDDLYAFRIKRAAVRSPFNPRITNIYVYCRMKDTEDPWIKIVDVNMTSGIYSTDGANYAAWDEVDGSGVSTGIAPSMVLITMPSVTYEMSSGISEEEDNIFARYKTACITNRRCYIGNIHQGNIRSGDRMIKSPVNKFDTFPSSNYIDVAINDGDEIVKLVAFGDRILQFKKRHMYVINVSEDIEYLESTHKYMGTNDPCSICETPYGIAWANEFGVYFYTENGKVTELSEPISDDWKSAVSETNMISLGYDKESDSLVIMEDCDSGGDIFLYQFKTKSWQRGSSVFTSGDYSNFAVDEDGALRVYSDPDSNVLEWDDAGDSSSNVEVKTKEFTFDYPGLEKKIYKVIITASNGANTKVTAAYDGGDFSDIFTENNVLSSDDPGENELTVTSPTWKRSFQLKIENNDNGDTGASFEIDDITIIYRVKGMR